MKKALLAVLVFFVVAANYRPISFRQLRVRAFRPLPAASTLTQRPTVRSTAPLAAAVKKTDPLPANLVSLSTAPGQLVGAQYKRGASSFYVPAAYRPLAPEYAAFLSRGRYSRIKSIGLSYSGVGSGSSSPRPAGRIRTSASSSSTPTAGVTHRMGNSFHIRSNATLAGQARITNTYALGRTQSR